MRGQRGMAAEDGKSSSQQVDVGIIIALKEEFAELHRQIKDHCEAIPDTSNKRFYYLFDHPGGGDQTYRCAATFVGEMGPTKSALLTKELIDKWKPETVVMLGIAGGLSEDVRLGDVVVATQVDSYMEHSKAVETSGGSGFAFKFGGEVYRTSGNLINFVRNIEFAKNECFQRWLKNCADDRQNLVSGEECKGLRDAKLLGEQARCLDGHIASGPTVGVAKAFSEWLKGRDRKYLALEMEAAGLMAAVYEEADSRRTLVLRGISDFADERKGKLDKLRDGAFRRYAMRNVIQFLWCLLDAGVLPMTRDGVSGRPGRRDEPTKPEVSLAKLPSTSPKLFGREKELEMLDEAWDDPETRVISLVAFGGVGKSALVNVWLNRMEKDGYRGAERVYGWSFYSQGAREGAQASADEFIAAALGWFGDPNPAEGSPWDKGERLAGLVREQRTLLILDGLEPVQSPPGGEIKDQSLKSLLRELARQNPGLCVITTRLNVDDLKDCVGTSVKRVDLEKLSPEAGAELLRNLGAGGTGDELKQSVKEFEGHALALTLLGRYVAVVHSGDIRQRDKIDKLTKEPKEGGHARRVMESYERWFDGKPELDILRIMGLFDRPAEGGAIEAVRADPVIEGLTSELKLSHADWQFAPSNLREIRLLAPEDTERPDSLDCHPLIREHFGEKLREENPNAWREAHSRLYEYYKSQPQKDLPDTIEEMAPLFAAVGHGCQAGRHQEALEEVYYRRILRGGAHFSWKQLGAFGADLAAMSGFFEPPWDRPVTGLTKDAKAFVLSQAGLCLRALGRLAEAAQPMQAALDASIAQKDWVNAPRDADNLSQLYLTIGDVSQAVDSSRQGVELAGRSGDDLWQMVLRTGLADALHQSGQVQEAEARFREAEKIQREHEPKYPLLYSTTGFTYCDLLLGLGNYQEVQNRARRTLEDGKEDWYSLLSTALDHLSLGRAHLLQARAEGTRDFTQAADELDQAVDGLRQAGTQNHLPRALLARAELHRVCGDLDRAQQDLEEAMTIATRGGMRLHEADCHLEYARLYMAMGNKEKARESLSIARKMINEMGYGRRRKDIAEIEGQS